jgi:heptosyltransferase-1
MGDILHALPAITALRQQHPEWVIDWVVEPRWSALLAASDSEGRCTSCSFLKPDPRQPLVDNLILAATKEWRKKLFSRKTLGAVRDLRGELQAGDYDATLDMQGAIRSSIVSKFAGSRTIIGAAEPRERPAKLLYTDFVRTHGEHVIEQAVELAMSIAGDELEPVRPILPVDSAAEAWAEALLARKTDAAAGLILINPGAGWGAKRWPVERYAEVSQHFASKGYRILINIGPGEEALAEAIQEQAGPAAIPLNCTLAQLIAVSRRIDLAIAGDTGPLHLACALGKPVVGIYGPTDPGRNGPYGTHFRVLRSPESKRDHTRRADPEAGLLTIQPAAVVQAAEELLYAEKV